MKDILYSKKYVLYVHVIFCDLSDTFLIFKYDISLTVSEYFDF
jgi:hypothetical protein